MGLLRSETMAHGTLLVPAQDARKFVDQIGKEVNIQFQDMNADQMRRPYRKFIQRIDEMERILRFVFEELGKVEGCTIHKNKVQEFLDADEKGEYRLDEVEANLKKLYTEFVKSKDNNEKLTDVRNQAMEESKVVATAKAMLQSVGITNQVQASADLQTPLITEDSGSSIGRIAGVIARADQARFERAVWKASLGNAMLQFEPIEEKMMDPKTGVLLEKIVFVIYFQGVQGRLQQNIKKICTGFGASLYTWPSSKEDADKRDQVLQQTLREADMTLKAHSQIVRTQCEDLFAPARGNGNSTIEEWRLFALKEKSLYAVLNLCQDGQQLKANVWFPAAEEEKIVQLLNTTNQGRTPGDQAALVTDKGPLRGTPPTYIRTNEYTQGWQDIINTYGIPKYQEANPALLTVVTFPFIFGMMYGDIGHGSMLLMVGIYLCWNGESFRYTQPAIFGARFMVLSMGLFATYSGLIYNDFFSVSLAFFTSGFKETSPGHFEPQFDATGDGCANPNGGNGPYPFGLDAAWGGADNELIYVNSLKMKLSVLFGVLQMFVGVCLKWSNAFYTRNKTDFFCECIPMMVFLVCFFGWMDVMILYKWTHVIDNPPNIINSLITMAMGLGVSNADTNPLWAGSIEMARQLMVYTVCAVPIMLLPKPFLLLWQHNQEEKQKAAKGTQVGDQETGHHGGHGDHGEEFEFGEIFIHQVIETIEFVLGTVSHTASYLRIWALSLAHQQLSLVFFQKTLTMGLEMPFPQNGIALYFLFAAWFGITLGVLLGMDVLECFLHTLRLHWVEFQSKFYKANGDEFAPYNIRKLVEPTGDM